MVGLFLSLFLYTFTSFTTLTCFYMYFLRVHMNGRLLDVYHRLKSPEENFFIPRDMEVSNEELGFVCRKAEQWRGAEGERRKVAVYDYVWEVDEVSKRDWLVCQTAGHIRPKRLNTLVIRGVKETLHI